MNKQYLLMVDEPTMIKMAQIFAAMGVQFLEVQGLGMAGGAGNMLMTPNRPPVPLMDLPVPQLAPQDPPPCDPGSEPYSCASQDAPQEAVQ